MAARALYEATHTAIAPRATTPARAPTISGNPTAMATYAKGMRDNGSSEAGISWFLGGD